MIALLPVTIKELCRSCIGMFISFLFTRLYEKLNEIVMKPLLLLLVIHILILHQYQKDKNETLAPRKSNNLKAATQSQQPEVLSPARATVTDSLVFSYQQVTAPHLKDSMFTAFSYEQ
jgi:hypothetical protein